MTAKTKILDAPWLDQHEKWPTGCESVSTALCLTALGFDADPDFIIDRCLPKAPVPRIENGVWFGADPRYFYLGDPRTEDGWGCFAPAVRRTVETCAALRGYKLRAAEVYGKTLETLFREEIDEGRPVIVFATMGMAKPRESRRWFLDGSGETYVWKTPMHCLLLTGYDGDTAVFSDPLAEAVTRYPLADAEFSFRGMGMQAVTVRRLK